MLCFHPFNYLTVQGSLLPAEHILVYWLLEISVLILHNSLITTGSSMKEVKNHTHLLQQSSPKWDFSSRLGCSLLWIGKGSLSTLNRRMLCKNVAVMEVSWVLGVSSFHNKLMSGIPIYIFRKPLFNFCLYFGTSRQLCIILYVRTNAG